MSVPQSSDDYTQSDASRAYTLSGRKRDNLAAIMSILVPIILVVFGICLCANIPDSMADPGGPFAPTVHPRQTSRVSPRSTTPSVRNKTTAHPKPTPTFTTPSSMHTTHPTSITTSTISVHPTSSSRTSSGANGRGGGTSIGRGDGSRRGSGNGPGGFFHNFNPCNFTSDDFSRVGLLPMTPRGLPFVDSSHGGKITWQHRHGGIAVIEESCRYADSDNLWVNHHLSIGKVSYPSTGKPLSLADYKIWATNLAHYFCDSIARFDNTVINGNPAVIEREFDRFGNLINYGIYINGVGFWIGVKNQCNSLFDINTGAHVSPSDFDKLLIIVKKTIPQA